jgi:aldehyde dehydrogenase (NAD(P)+)
VQTEHSAAADAVTDSALAALAEGEKKWSRQSLTGRRALLDRVRALTGQHAQDWVDAAVGIKGLDPSSLLVGEEWMSGPYVLAASLAAVSCTLESLEQGTSPLAKAKFRIRQGQGDRAGAALEPVRRTSNQRIPRRGVVAARHHRGVCGIAQLGPTRTGGIAAVLGAGNISSIAPLDTIYELIAHNRVVALKLNPVTDPLLPVFERIFAPLIELG